MSLIRAFIAIELSPQIQAHLAQLIHHLSSQIPRGVRWVNPRGIHLTLKFLGDVPEENVPPLGEALSQASRGVAPFSLALGQGGAFPSLQRPRVFWIGLTGDIEALMLLQRNVEQALAREGFPVETRAFSPHLTLGRVREQSPPPQLRHVDQILADLNVDTKMTLKVERLALIQSRLTPEGAGYTPLLAVQLTHPLPR